MTAFVMDLRKEWFPGTVAFFVGAVASVIWYRHALGAVLGALAWPWVLAYERVGFVFVILFPMSIYVTYSVVLALLVRYERARWGKAQESTLRWITDLAPALGLIQTFLSLAIAMGSLDLAKGMSASINGLTRDIGQALGSSVMGLSIGMAAFSILHFTQRDLSKED